MAEAAQLPTKKRKRTGKEREERKKAAIQAKVEAEAEAVDVVVETPQVGESVTDAPDLLATTTSTIDLERLTSRIPTALKHLHPIFKQTRTFETRRLIKKIKFLRTKSGSEHEITDLEGQLHLLSHINLTQVIQTHLLLKLRKHPKLRNTPFPSSIVHPLKTVEDANNNEASTSTGASLLTKVENRLCSSKVAAEGVKNTLAWLVGEEGVKLAARESGKKSQVKEEGMLSGIGKRVSTGQTVQEDTHGDIADEDSASDEEIIRPRRIAREQSHEVDGVDEDAVSWVSGSVSGGDPLDDDKSVNSESDEESGSDNVVPLPTKKGRNISKPSSPANPKSANRGQPVPPPKAQPKTKTKSKPVNSPITSSTFLPSLSVGYTLGPDDSDPEMDDDPTGSGVIGSSGVGVERKNRRGQRARQAIWEKKFGRGAKHLVKRAVEGQDGGGGDEQKGRGYGYGESRGESERGRGRFGIRGSGRGRGDVERGRGGFVGAGRGTFRETPTAPLPMASPTVSSGGGGGGGKNLHPSWEAARLRKQKESGMGPVGTAKATKIVFD